MNYGSADRVAAPRRILVAPLDWGLGHATRCIPVIYELLRQNVAVWLAGEGAQEILLKKEFPGLPFLYLRGYRVKYGRSSLGLLPAILGQIPSILRSIREEHQWLKQVVQQQHFDAVISDNRYGLHHPGIPSVFITHQLKIKTPFGRWGEQFLQKRNYRLINQFSECWIPDQETGSGLAGELSHPLSMPSIPVKYLGILSRLKKIDTSEKKNHLFISLSGPEPQRTILENKIIDEVVRYNGSATIVRGLPAETTFIPSTNDIVFYNHLSDEELNREMQKAEYVISRSGYSTVMDITRLGKKSILIPTPGQTEQEYLARYLNEKKLAVSFPQKEFDLNHSLEKAARFPYLKQDNLDYSDLASPVSSLLNKLSVSNKQ